MTGPNLPGPIAYLTGEYPRATDTFIQREVAALRALGIDVRTCTVRATDPSHHVGPEQKAEFAATFQVQTAARSPLRLIRAHLSCLRRPAAWLSAAKLAVQTCPPGLKPGLWQLFYFLQAGVLAHHMRSSGIAHLHNHFGNSSCSVAMLAACMAERSYSYTMHGPMEFFAPEHWRIDVKIARAAFVACISYFARAQGMIFADQAHWPRMKIVHCGVVPALYQASETRGQDPEAPEIIFIGRLAAIKGVALLIDAVDELIQTVPRLRLTLVGDGPERSQLEAQVAALGLADHVTFTGYLGQKDVAARLARADIFALPSFAEGVPVVLMEAMAAGLPVVTSQVAGISELVGDGVSGYCIPPGDLRSLTTRLLALLSDAPTRRTMGASGRAKVHEAFDVAKEAAWLAELMQGVDKGQLPAKVWHSSEM